MPLLITVEDHSVYGGLGSSVANWVAMNEAPARLVKIGVEGYQSSGASADLFARAGLDAEGIAERIRVALGDR
jgi:transketolase